MNRLRILLLLSVAVFLGACASVREGVVGSTRADISPFATEAINTLSVDSMQLQRNRLTRLRLYFDDETIETNNMLAIIDRIESFRRSIALYSLELVYIARLPYEPAEKSRLLSEYIDKNFGQAMIENLGMERSEVQDTLNTIAAQDSFLDAIKAVQPLVRAATVYHEQMLREIERIHMPVVLEFFDEQVEDDYQYVIAQEEALETRRDELMQALLVLDDVMAGDRSRLEELHNQPAFRSSASRPPLDAGESALRAAEDYLIDELQRNAQILELIQPSLVAYYEARAELEDLADRIKNGIRVARFQLAAWRKAHEDLGNGVRNPGRWLAAAFGAAALI